MIYTSNLGEDVDDPSPDLSHDDRHALPEGVELEFAQPMERQLLVRRFPSTAADPHSHCPVERGPEKVEPRRPALLQQRLLVRAGRNEGSFVHLRCTEKLELIRQGGSISLDEDLGCKLLTILRWQRD